MNVLSRILFVFLLIIPAVSAELPGDRVAGEQIKQEILAWLDSFQSLQFKFRYRFDVSHGRWKEQEIEYRRQGNMIYYHSIVLGYGGFDAEPVGSVLIESLVDGKCSLLTYQGKGVSGEINRKNILTSYTILIDLLFEKIPIDEVAEYSPYAVGVHTILSLPGKSTLLKRGGEKTLVYWSESEELYGLALNLRLDKQNRIIEVDYVVRPFYSPEEVQLWATKDIHEVVQRMSSIELADYKEFNGIWLPCYMKQTKHNSTEESRSQYVSIAADARRDGRNLCEYYVRLFEGLEYEKGNSHTEEVRIDPGTVKINDTLNKSDFEIDFPPYTSIVDRETNEVITTARETWLERHANLVIILIALGILGGITVAGWRYWLGKP